MPCNSVITVTVEMGMNVDTGLLHEALKKLSGAQPVIRLADGSLDFTHGKTGTVGRYDKTTKSLSLRMGPWGMKAPIINEIKAAYSYQVVMSALRRVGGAATTKVEGQSQVVHVRLADGR